MTAAPFDVLQPGAPIPRHRHATPYAAVVLSGGYEEAGDGGRFQVEAGDVLIHAAFSAHLNRVPARRTVVLNLPLPWLWAEASTRMRIDDADAVARLAASDIRDGQALLLARLTPGPAGDDDDADILARALSSGSPPPVSAWSRMSDVARQTAWRRFTTAYGAGPARYRVEARARRAWRRLFGDESLSGIALAEGFADQAHMTRDVRALTGHTPGRWRAMQHSFKTGADRAVTFMG